MSGRRSRDKGGRAAGFRQLYNWLDRRDVLIVKSDRQEPLVVVRLSLAENQGHMA
jgi:hypothetical protein